MTDSQEDPMVAVVLTGEENCFACGRILTREECHMLGLIAYDCGGCGEGHFMHEICFDLFTESTFVGVDFSVLASAVETAIQEFIKRKKAILN